MKKNISLLIGGLFTVFIYSCNDDSTTSTTTTTDSTANNPTMQSADSSTNTSPTVTATPLAAEDSLFIMKAAMGGMEEVELGNIAIQNAASQRVKDFGGMMVRDHSKANMELKAFADSRGLSLPNSLPAEKQSHIEAMRKMTGKSFDKHYMDMMVNDHKKDISEFDKASKNAKDNDLKNWAGQTLPVLQSHLDSAKAVSRAK